MSVPTNQQQTVGTTFAEHYEILSLLGTGGMGAVYLARHRLLDRQVAIKVLHEHLCGDKPSIERIRQEGRTAACLDHPNIVKIHHLGISADGRPFLVMDYLQGSTLSEILATGSKLSLESFYAIFDQCLDALSHARRAGVVHRDLKPGNIMIGAGNHVQILDLGIATILPPETPATGACQRSIQALTRTGALIGSPCYMSPEQCLGQAPDHRSDIYAIGCVMYETLMGRPPFQGSTALDTMYKHVNSPVADLASEMRAEGISSRLSELVLQSLEKNPHDRPQTATAFRHQLASCQVGCAAGTQPLAPKQNKTGARQNLPAKPGQKSILLAAVATLTVIASFLALRLIDRPPAPPAEKQPPTPICLPDPQSARAANQQAEWLIKQGQCQAAENCYRRALALAKTSNDQREQIVACLALPGIARLSPGQAQASFDEALRLSRQFYGANSFQHSETLMHYADWLRDRDRTFEAKATCETVISIREKILEGSNRVQMATPSRTLADIYMTEKNYSKAEHYFKQAAELYAQGNETPWSEPLNNLDDWARCLMTQGKWAEAVPLLEQHVVARLQREDTTPEQAAAAIFELAEAYRHTGRYRQAATRYEQALAFLKNDPAARAEILPKIELGYAIVSKKLNQRPDPKNKRSGLEHNP